MCGIVGYIGHQAAAPVLVEGLTRLEYRGYDSAGLAVLGAKGTTAIRRVGRVRELEAALPKRLTGTVGIGHTRWATHGPAVEQNAHPQRSQDGRISVVHNGIIDNAAALRAQLAQTGVEFSSDTDTEVVAHLIAQSEAATLEEAVLAALGRITGTYALAVLDERHPDRIVLARSGSPLIIGIGDKEMLVASDVAALVRHTDRVVHLDDGELATVTATGFRTFDRGNSPTSSEPVEISVAAEDLELSGYQHFMLKEIHEQPDAAAMVLRGRLDERFATARLDGLGLDPRELRGFRRIKILGCGSAYYVGQLGAQLIEDLARIPADAEAASEFRYRQPIIESDTLYVAVSQSGETADTAFAVEEIKRKGGRVIGVVNVVGSTIARTVDGGIYLHAGPEISVASTKALTNMALSFALLALHLGRLHDLSHADGQRILRGLQRIPEQIREILDGSEAIAAVADDVAKAQSAFYVGRVRGFPVAREGAQKLKEISYIHAEAYQTSELKHGPLALIDPDMPTVAVIPDDELTDRNLAAAEQILARKGPLIAITHAGVDLGHLAARTILVPKNEPELDPILLTIPTQLLAYHAAVLLGHDVDKPRNLAKSVTVE
ncbi:glutamine--fructose-6-phosphate transaminase (isomerizing) [Microbacterium azadirachtae]|uniref:Glutamine--fructose-6-phosphate aminotransferase [isomerizing] n=1 Tax=Microbacterium azadirachtae TaxID=582680 RepID=A0A0F0KGH0_9MICO|nr:glutamine--fructose-6-phosphate transaminase (isomerizing) [Microbacterium azadirachtae]KJL19963.1 Glutamine--fructose-6-phosphate aminotransferase [isomerizing] [Microbacterium azadirachtae]UXW86556.1 glutamine--fructose-6-phosphate transaminase (isomerizing) [Microbacterium azadirachtae]SDL87245.1 glucosamine--fructose-6-phosphate aminotransferase (isomerizing) [Microbacterium azadirachtae]SEG20124.1 glucosamine--fructose-6-phosphate aminotransferase (isomerizing) [Microbacterium azadirach